MSSGIQWDTAVQQQLASRGVDKNTGVYGQHKVQLGKGSPIRLDKIKSASIPYAGFTKAEKIRRGKAGVQQSAGDALKTLAKPGALDAKHLLEHIKAVQTQYERLDKLGDLSLAQKESKLWMFTSQVESLTNEELAAIYQNFTSAEMDLLQTALLREAQFSAEASDASNAADALFDLQALIIREISNRSANAQIDDMAAANPAAGAEAEDLRPQSLTAEHGGQAAPGIHDPAGQHGMSAYSLHTLAETASGSALRREKNAVLEQSRLSARKIDDVTVRQMGDVLRGSELTINVKTEHLIGGANSIFEHPDDPLVNIFHLAGQGVKPRGDGYLTVRDNVEKNLFPALNGHEIRADERPMYGALNISGRRGGAISSMMEYGSTAIVLKPHVARRATYTVNDSFMNGKVSVTPERRQNFYRLLDGSNLPQAAKEALRDPNSGVRRDFDAFLDKLAANEYASTAFFASNLLPISVRDALRDPADVLDVTRFNLDTMRGLCVQCFSDSEAMQNATATYDNLESLVTAMPDVEGNVLAMAAQKKASGQKAMPSLAGAQYIEAQIHGPIIPSRDIAEIRINMADVPDDGKAALREQARAYQKATGIKVTLIDDMYALDGADDLAINKVRHEAMQFNDGHMDSAALEALKQDYLQNMAAKIQEYIRDNKIKGLPEGALRLEGNALQNFASKFFKEIDDRLRTHDNFYRDSKDLVETAFNETLRPVINRKAALLRELEAIASEEPPMTAAQKEAFTKWIVSAKALRSPEELRIIAKHARAQAELLREVFNAEPALSPAEICRRMAALGKGVSTDLSAFIKTLPPDADFGTDEKNNEMDRISFMSLALVQHGEPPLDKAALQKLHARMGGPEMLAFIGQMESVCRDPAMENLPGFAALNQIKTQMWLNAGNAAVLTEQRRPGLQPFAGELSLLQEPFRAAMREVAPDVAQKLEEAHPPYAPMPAPANPQALPQNEAQRRAFCVNVMDNYMDIEKIHEKGRSVHGRGHIARSYIFANVMCNMLEEAGIKVDKNAVLLSISGHDMGRSGRGNDQWEKNSANMTVGAMQQHYGQGAMGQEYEQHISGCIIHDSPQNNTLEAMIMRAADSLDIGRTKDFDPEQFPFLKGKPGEAPGEEAQKIRGQLAKEADLLQRMTNPLCANRQALFKLMNDAGSAPTTEIMNFFQEQSSNLQQQIADEFAKDFDVSSEDYMTRFEDTVRQNPKMFPLLSRYYH